MKFFKIYDYKGSDERVSVRTMFDIPLRRLATAAAAATIPGTTTLHISVIESALTEG